MLQLQQQHKTIAATLWCDNRTNFGTKYGDGPEPTNHKRLFLPFESNEKDNGLAFCQFNLIILLYWVDCCMFMNEMRSLGLCASSRAAAAAKPNNILMFKIEFQSRAIMWMRMYIRISIRIFWPTIVQTTFNLCSRECASDNFCPIWFSAPSNCHTVRAIHAHRNGNWRSAWNEIISIPGANY